jgi:excisionase family DNA binding protein
MNRHDQEPIVEPDDLAANYMSSADAALALGVSRQRVSALVKAGRLQAVRVHGGRVMVAKESVAAYQREREIGRPYPPEQRIGA